MSVELTVPEVGESITEVQIGRWLKADGEAVGKDEDLVETQTEKASVVIPAPRAGVLTILKPEGEFADVGVAIARIDEGEAKTSSDDTPDARADDEDAPDADASGAEAGATTETSDDDGTRVMPAAARLLREHELDAAQVGGTGPGGRILKEDVLRHLAERDAREAARQALDTATPLPAPAPGPPTGARAESIRPMSMMRRTIASRLVQAQQEAALLTTFNEIDMLPVKELRRRHGEAFAARHGVKLGFMSFFVKAAVEALRRFPAVNAEIRGDQIVSRDYHDIGIAIGGGKGLLVPVLRDAATLGFADIEHRIADLAARAAGGNIGPDDLEGGTFTISNGGIYGSLLSTPIVNPPQSGILGMHSIQDRPVIIEGEIVIRPMMYVALTYDHRIIDGREAVSFLRTIKDAIEEPARLLLEV